MNVIKSKPKTLAFATVPRHLSGPVIGHNIPERHGIMKQEQIYSKGHNISAINYLNIVLWILPKTIITHEYTCVLNTKLNFNSSNQPLTILKSLLQSLENAPRIGLLLSLSLSVFVGISQVCVRV